MAKNQPDRYDGFIWDSFQKSRLVLYPMWKSYEKYLRSVCRKPADCCEPKQGQKRKLIITFTLSTTTTDDNVYNIIYIKK
jgi:hypothetical protein